jgi:hypothetical protein
MHKKIIGMVCLTMFGVQLASKGAEVISGTNQFEVVYKELHQALALPSHVSDPMAEYGPAGPALNKIKRYGLRMATFMCEKVLNNTGGIYDAEVLDRISGINLAYDKISRENYGQAIKLGKIRFNEEWRAGVYEHPDKLVAEFLNPLVKNEPVTNINVMDIAEIMRFGIYSVPELVRQVREHNSSHAFVLYLRATGQMGRYSDYLKNPQIMCVTKEEKLKHIENRIKEYRAFGEGELPVVKKIEAALREQT